jgi:HlyD family secretion protein
MKKWIIGIIVLAIVAVGAYLVPGGGLARLSASEPTPEAEALLPAVRETHRVVAEAKVVPAQYATLSLAAGGVVVETMVDEGDDVEAGQILLRVEAAQQVAAVAQAEAGLRGSQARLDELKVGPRPQEIAVAQAAIEAAQAGLARITEAARPEEVAAAEAALDSAQASLQKVLEGPDEEEITIAAAGLRRAEVSLKQAQWAYDQVAYGADIGATPQAAQLEQATLEYETALANYQLAVRGPTQADVEAARAQLAQAETNLALLMRGASDAEVAAAEAEIHRALAQLDLVKAGARPETIAAAEADVAAAEAALAQAQAALAETELHAPLAGTIAALDAKVGEHITSGTPVAHLADFSAWHVETDDLTELGVVGITASDPVTFTVDAIPDLELVGHVTRIKPIGEDKRGDITYTAVIQPDQAEERLRWNMTTAVYIQPSQAPKLAEIPGNQ